MKSLLVLLLLASPALAQVPTSALRSEAVFQEWAKQHNADQYTEAHQRALQARAEGRYPTQTGLATESKRTKAFFNPTFAASGVQRHRGNDPTYDARSSKLEFERQWKNLNDDGGGQVLLINPYCYDYWKDHDSRRSADSTTGGRPGPSVVADTEGTGVQHRRGRGRRPKETQPSR